MHFSSLLVILAASVKQFRIKILPTCAFPDVLNAMSSHSTASALIGTSLCSDLMSSSPSQPATTSALMYEPEISIRRLYKCCSQSCGPSCHATGDHSNCNIIGRNSHLGRTMMMFPSKSSGSGSSSILFQCEYCEFSCSWKYDLKLHLKQKHGIHKKVI